MKFVTLAVKGGERKYTEGTSGHVDGVRVENCVFWTAAQIHPQNSGVLAGSKMYEPKSEKNTLQETC